MSLYSFPLNDNRERLLDRLKEETGATTRAEAIESAIRHFVEDKQKYEEHWERVCPR